VHAQDTERIRGIAECTASLRELQLLRQRKTESLRSPMRIVDPPVDATFRWALRRIDVVSPVASFSQQRAPKGPSNHNACLSQSISTSPSCQGVNLCEGFERLSQRGDAATIHQAIARALVGLPLTSETRRATATAELRALGTHGTGDRRVRSLPMLSRHRARALAGEAGALPEHGVIRP
jgi:hypothetical protein